jgi:transcriptional regulator with XRE-family HTH domain
MKIEIKIKLKDGTVIDVVSKSEAIKTARNKAGLTQKEVAEILGIDQRNVNQYESGNRIPREKMLDEIARATNAEIEILQKTE